MSASHTPWREDPRLAGLLHPDEPDDLQVLVHDGEPRRTQRAPEGCWVRITDMEPAILRPVIYNPENTPLSREEFATLHGAPSSVYVGVLLNQPHHLKSVKQGDRIHFLSVPGLPLPLQVTQEYLRERPLWNIQPCGKCGCSECFDPPSRMFRTRFPDAPPDAMPEMFTAFCAMCGGIMALASKTAEQGPDDEGDDEKTPAPSSPKKPWWKVW